MDSNTKLKRKPITETLSFTREVTIKVSPQVQKALKLAEIPVAVFVDWAAREGFGVGGHDGALFFEWYHDGGNE